MKRPLLKVAGMLTATLISCSFMQTAMALPAQTANPDSSPSPAVTVATVAPDLDTTNVLRNPGTGWVMYAPEVGDPFPNADEFWKNVGPYSDASSVVYMRIPWSRLEPTEGRYAWNEDANFISMIKQAKEHGQRLAFRVIMDSQDGHQQATPEFVFKAGAKGYGAPSNRSLKTPYVTDPVFRTKYENFVKAFGEQFDDPDVVDFVDTNTIGYWGEMHSVQGMNGAQGKETLRWLGDLYRDSFKNVLLALNFAPGFSYDDLDEQLDAGSIMRRDSLGSTQWFPQDQKDAIASRFPDTILVGENCYQSFTVRATSCDASFKDNSATPYRAMLERVVKDAKDLHSNYLDLRNQPDVKTWVVDNPDLVTDFAVNGGYRLAPTSVSFPTNLPAANPAASISATWANSGVGRLPNDNPQWNFKYQVSYALLDQSTGTPVYQVQSEADPGSWLKGTPFEDTTAFAPTGVPAGSYDFAVSIVDTTKNSEPAIKLALTGETSSTGWNKLGSTTIEAAARPTVDPSNPAATTPPATTPAATTPAATIPAATTPDVPEQTMPAASTLPATTPTPATSTSAAAGAELASTGWGQTGLWAAALLFLAAGGAVMLLGRRQAKHN